MSEGNIENQYLNNSTTKEECQSLFSLKKANSSSTAPFISVDFSLPSHLKEDPLLNSINLLPTYNCDGKYYTPSFILSSQMSKYIANDEGYKLIHQKKIQQMQQEKAQIYVPKPSKANSYCCICKCPFDDYLTHINIPKHRELMKKSEFCQHIQDMCQNISQKHNGTTILEEENRKTENIFIAKKKKIIKIVHSQEPKRGRGRPRKNLVSHKLQMLASIPTNVSISL